MCSGSQSSAEKRFRSHTVWCLLDHGVGTRECVFNAFTTRHPQRSVRYCAHKTTRIRSSCPGTGFPMHAFARLHAQRWHEPRANLPTVFPDAHNISRGSDSHGDDKNAQRVDED